jgi:DNA invertase Pin-like site-specific DNA recombinase
MTKSRQFRRVSSDDQDYGKQVADLDAWDVSHGYTQDGTYEMSASAYHGRQIPELERAVWELESGAFSVLTFWAADRMWRGESLAKVLGYCERIHAAGGRVEFVKDAHLNYSPDVEPWVRNMLLAQAFGAAHGESRRKSQRAKMDVQAKRVVNAAHGRPPFGYEIRGPKDAKVYVPTQEGRKIVQALFHDVIDGRPLKALAAELSVRLGRPVGHRWIGHKVIANPAFYGARSGVAEAMVTHEVWLEANAALASRQRGTREPGTRPLLLVKTVACSCGGVMYRSGDGSKFYCRGRNDQGACGARVTVLHVEQQARALVSQDTRPETRRVFVPGTDRTTAMARLTLSITEAAGRGDVESLAALTAEMAALKGSDDVPSRWDEVPTGRSLGRAFSDSAPEQQRQELTRWTVTWDGEHVLVWRKGMQTAIGREVDLRHL